jgi:hypothetical protein
MWLSARQVDATPPGDGCAISSLDESEIEKILGFKTPGVPYVTNYETLIA